MLEGYVELLFLDLGCCSINLSQVVEFDSPAVLLADSASQFFGLSKEAGLVKSES